MTSNESTIVLHDFLVETPLLLYGHRDLRCPRKSSVDPILRLFARLLVNKEILRLVENLYCKECPDPTTIL